MWNNSKQTPQGGKNDEDDSWEIRAFEEDTAGNLLGCTWPPRSYACTFCRREFRSAQALGGHMNVHRRDRVRLHHEAPAAAAVMPPSPAAAVFIPAGQEFVGNGLCILYPLQNPNNPNNALPMEFTSPLLPILPLVASRPNDGVGNNSVVSSVCCSGNEDLCSPSDSNEKMNKHGKDENHDDMEELDLELRLGRKSAER